MVVVGSSSSSCCCCCCCGMVDVEELYTFICITYKMLFSSDLRLLICDAEQR